MVCEGNICRSPMAEAIFRHELGLTWPVESAGLQAPTSHKAHPFAIEVCAAAGIDLSSHRSRQLTPEIVRSADIIFAMETIQVERILRANPWSKGKVWRLANHEGKDLPDLLPAPRTEFETFLHTTQRALSQWAPFLRS
jgi:protein-tyrosine phosphatase